MNTKFFSLFASLTLGGAVIWFVVNRPPAHHAKNVVVLEATDSVPADARGEIYAAVEANVGYLKRGDELILVPLTSDAATEAAGRVLRLRVSDKRKAYDADLKQTRASLMTMLDQMRDESVTKPYLRTDLLGTVRLAAEERKPNDPKEAFTLILLSDLINDTPQLSFMTSPLLANETSARKFADQLMIGHEKSWTGARVFLGQLRSNDLKRVNPQRREAIRAFWVEYFHAGGAAEVVFATDGVGQLSDFIRSAK